MSRASLRALPAVAIAVWLTSAWALDPHMDPSSLPAGCVACHRGHGEAGSPMLPSPQSDLCMSCHGTQSGRDRAVLQGRLAPGLQPALLSSTLALPFTHPITPGAYSRDEPGAVVCTSCHSPHRSAADRAPEGDAAPLRKVSTRSKGRWEYETCRSCHGSRGITTNSPLDLGRLLQPDSRSFHPVEAPARDRSPSVAASLSGGMINCTDCHGSSDPAGPRGPHGSSVRYLLRDDYATVDGRGDSPAASALCTACHDRQAVLDSPNFPLHRLHVEERKASCATCHNAHGSLENRALIRFGEETFVAGVAPSGRTGRLEFASDAAGSGSCMLTCHGHDHAPEVYGGYVTLEGPDGPFGGDAGAAPSKVRPVRPRRRDR